MKRVRNEGGSITVEATISLTAFMFAIVTILTIVNICIVQARISYALNSTAKEISQYSYLYSLTGLNDAQKAAYDNGKQSTEKVVSVLSDVNEVYNEIQNLQAIGETKVSVNNIDSILSAWDSAAGSAEKIENAGSSLENTLSDIASDPKNLMFGLVKMAASETMDLAKSRLIAAPLAKVMMKKHLVNEKGGDVNAYLKFLRVVPGASGSYLDGLDFSQSHLFPNGSNSIKINVSYDVKLIALLPIDFKFHFNQSAVTCGWSAGDVSFESAEEYVENDTLWTKATIQERSNMIRSMGIAEYSKDGYYKTSGLTDVQMFNPDKNEFVMFASMNPLYSGEGQDTLTLADLDDEALKNNIERLSGKMASTTDGLKKVKIKKDSNGSTTKQEINCAGADNKIVLVVPQDEGLKEKIEKIIKDSDTKGVEFEVIASYGNGAQTSVKNPEKEGSSE